MESGPDGAMFLQREGEQDKMVSLPAASSLFVMVL
jgi:hypothetical protein